MNMRRARRLAIVTILGLGFLAMLAPKIAWAQGSTWAGESLAQLLESARWRLGPLRANGSLELNNAGYDTDIYYGYLSEATPDFTLTAGAPLQLLVPLGKSVVIDLNEFPQYLFYAATARERAWNNRFRGQVHIALEKLYVQAGGGLSNVRSRLSPELDINIREKTERLDGLALWQVSRLTSLAVIFGRVKHEFGDSAYQEQDIARALNRIEDSIDLNFYIQPNPRARLFLDGQYGRYDFLDETLPSKNAKSYGIFGGVDFLPRAGEILEATGIEGGFRLGYQNLNIEDPSFVDGSGLVGEGDVSFDVVRRTRLRGFFYRGFQFSIFSDISYYLSTFIGGGITRHLSRRTSLRYDFAYGRIFYPQETVDDGIPQGYFTHYTSHTASLEVRLSRGLVMTVFSSLGQRVLEENHISRSRNFFGINLIYGRQPALVSVPARGMAQ